MPASAPVFEGVDQVVYASPAEGGAQVALATVARLLSKQATIFLAHRAKPHARIVEAAKLGAKVINLPIGRSGPRARILQPNRSTADAVWRRHA